MRSLDLLDMASHAGRSIRELSTTIGLTPTGLGRAAHDGKLSPAVAAAVAGELGEDPAKWALIAAAESSKNPPTLQRRLNGLVRAAFT